MMHRTICTAASPVTVFVAQLDMHWETERRVVWNAQECATEQRELVYEVSWIPELAAWRRFLRSQRKVQN